MDVLTVGSKNYVKASVIARELGYTTDYVGQLCRGNKIDAKLFGRSWYVNRNSLHEHKSTRYRSTQAKSIKALQEAGTEESTAIPIHKPRIDNSRFYTHSTLKPSPRYISDETELFPEVGSVEKKQGNLKVNLADASAVKINSVSEKYIFDTPELPVIKFRGALTLSETVDGDENLPEGSVRIHPKEVKNLFGKRKANNKVISAVLPKQNVPEHKIIPVDLDPKIVTEVVFSDTQQEVTSSGSFMLHVAVSVVLSSLCVLVLLGFETHIDVVGSTYITKYVFGIHNLLASVSNAVTQVRLP